LGLVQQLTRHSNLLRARSKSGKVRLCHGDLHLRNIVLQNDQPCLFDALEFDDALATTDVLYDLAFLLMDLWHRDLKTHANRCFNTFASRSMQANELSGLALMPLFMSVRAAIRALVAVDKLAVAPDKQDRPELEEAHSYFSLANKFLETSEPVLMAVGGLSGTGKTTLAAAVAPSLGHAPGALHLRSDVERKRMLRVPVLDKLPPQAYTSQASHNVYRRLCNRAEMALRAGHSVVVDAVFLEPMHRRWIEKVALRCGCKFLGLWLEAEQDQMIERVTNREFDASDADGDVVRRQLKIFDYNACWSPIDTRGSAEAAVSQVRHVIQTNFPSASSSASSNASSSN
ncbi:MAG: AAA family ATPase, partial [Pseudomonadota bacterium]